MVFGARVLKYWLLGPSGALHCQVGSGYLLMKPGEAAPNFSKAFPSCQTQQTFCIRCCRSESRNCCRPLDALQTRGYVNNQTTELVYPTCIWRLFSSFLRNLGIVLKWLQYGSSYYGFRLECGSLYEFDFSMLATII